jgi:hypothetical protein
MSLFFQKKYKKFVQENSCLSQNISTENSSKILLFFLKNTYRGFPACRNEYSIKFKKCNVAKGLNAPFLKEFCNVNNVNNVNTSAGKNAEKCRTPYFMGKTNQC